jgi:hypothetical protein
MADTKPPVFTNEELTVPEDALLERARPAAGIEQGRFGTVILGSLVSVLLMILVALYYWYQLINSQLPVEPIQLRPTAEENQEPESTTARAQTDALTTMSTSDELSVIEADLEGTDLSNIETELNAIDAETENALSAPLAQ